MRFRPHKRNNKATDNFLSCLLLLCPSMFDYAQLDEEIKKHRDVTNKLTEVLNIFAGKPKGKPN